MRKKRKSTRITDKQYQAYLRQVKKARKKYGVEAVDKMSKTEYIRKRREAIAAGKKQFNVSLAKPKNAAFQEYIDRYNRKARQLGENIVSPLSRKGFERSLEDYMNVYDAGEEEAIKMMVSDSTISNLKQAKAMAENLKNHFQEWDSVPFSSLSEYEKKIYRDIKRLGGEDAIDASLFYRRTNEAAERTLFKHLDEADSWHFAVGS